MCAHTLVSFLKLKSRRRTSRRRFGRDGSEPEVKACGWLGEMRDFVDGQAIDIEIGDLVNISAIFRADTEGMRDVEVHTASVDECALGLSLRTGDDISVRWIKHQRTRSCE